MRRAQFLRLLAVIALGVAALLIVACALAWMLEVQPLDIVLLALLGPLVLIAYAVALVVRAHRHERRSNQ